MPRSGDSTRPVRPGTPHAAHRRDPAPTVPSRVEPEEVDPDEIIDPPETDGPDGAGIARAAATVLGHTGSWAAGAYLRAGRRMVGVVIAPASGLGLVRDLATETTRAFAAAAEATDLERRLDEAGPAGALIRRAGRLAGQLIPVDLSVPAGHALAAEPADDGRALTLREQGEALLRRSRDVDDDPANHPAYSRILSELAPDEARVLKLMLLDGPQPTVDVRTGGPVGLINSRLIAPGLSMIGPRAGTRHPERVPSYLNNLFRLGLIWFSRETLRDHQRYQVLEAQPDVLEAIHSTSAARVVRRSVHLTPFGEDFCRTCLSDPGERLDALPPHSAPRVLDPQPPADRLEP